MSQNVILVALAILPVIVLAIFVYRKDKFEKEPLRMLFKAFFFGCLSTIPAVFLETFLSAGGMSLTGALQGAYTGYVVAGCSEELCKLLLLTLAVWKSTEFNEYFDGIVYATFVSLGFAGLENLMYVFSQDTFSTAFATGSMRAVLSVPGHFLFGVVMGYYFALAKFQPKQRGANLFKAFFYPMLLHGTFDALLMIPEAMGEDGAIVQGVLFLVFIYFDIRLWRVAMRRLKHLQELSQGQQYDSYHGDDEVYGGKDDYGGEQGGDDPFSGFQWNV